MGRAVRIEFAGAIYHVVSRGNSQQIIFKDSADYKTFLKQLNKTAERYHWILFAFCLMPNHYHLLLETQKPNLSEGMRFLNSVYCQAFNRRHGRSGHVLQGRFHAILVERETYLLEVTRYIILNPVRAGLARLPEEWEWSSFNAMFESRASSRSPRASPLLSYFGRDTRSARQAFLRFVNDGIGAPSPLLEVRNELILGSMEYVRKLTPLLTKIHMTKSFPKIQRFATRPPLSDILEISPAQRIDPRKVKAAVEQYGYTRKEIAHHLGVDPTTVGRMIKKLRRK